MVLLEQIAKITKALTSLSDRSGLSVSLALPGPLFTPRKMQTKYSNRLKNVRQTQKISQVSWAVTAAFFGCGMKN